MNNSLYFCLFFIGQSVYCFHLSVHINHAPISFSDFKSKTMYVSMQSTKNEKITTLIPNTYDFTFHKTSEANTQQNNNQITRNHPYSFRSSTSSPLNFLLLLAPVILIFATIIPHSPISFIATAANAAIEDIFDPAKFNPVCHFSDVIYNSLKGFTGKQLTVYIVYDN